MSLQNIKQKINYSHPDFLTVFKIYKKLRAAGFTAYLAGGCVRDGLLGFKPNDFDIASSAKPEEVEALFNKVVPIGKEFGIVLVVEDGVEVEVARFRKDGMYKNGRSPESVEPGTAQEDAERRDFTVNAMFYDIEKEEVLDYTSGYTDLQKKVLRTVGDAKLRFQEDHLRILRLYRFISQLGFSVDQQSMQAANEQIGLIKTVSGERIFAELTKWLQGKYFEQSLPLILQSQILPTLFPKLNWAGITFNKLEGETEDMWFAFFSSLVAVNPNCSENDLEEIMLQMRFSKKLQQSIFRGLTWWLDNQLDQQVPGCLVERLFDPDYRRGFEAFKKGNPTKYKNVDRLISQWPEKPLPIIGAKDLQPYFQAFQLGQNLRRAYWAQLEGLVKTPEEALNWLGVNKQEIH